MPSLLGSGMAWSNVILDPTAADERVYRAPRQTRGQVKFERILDAADALLRERSIDEFGLRDVARRAGVASGSVYHFFPNNEVLYVALVERYNKIFVNLIREHVDKPRSRTWKDLIGLHFENAREYMNSNLPARTLILGSGRSWQSRQANPAGDADIARALEASLLGQFRLPSNPPPYELIYLGLRTLEGYWELSVRQHDRVTDDIARETTRAVTAYLGLYWPEYVDPA